MKEKQFRNRSADNKKYFKAYKDKEIKQNIQSKKIEENKAYRINNTEIKLTFENNIDNNGKNIKYEKGKKDDISFSNNHQKKYFKNRAVNPEKNIKCKTSDDTLLLSKRNKKYFKQEKTEEDNKKNKNPELKEDKEESLTNTNEIVKYENAEEDETQENITKDDSKITIPKKTVNRNYGKIKNKKYRQFKKEYDREYNSDMKFNSEKKYEPKYDPEKKINLPERNLDKDTKLDSKFQKSEKKISKLKQQKEKQQKLIFKDKKYTLNSINKGVADVSEVTSKYLESGKEDNSGVDAAYKISNTSSEIARFAYNKNNKGKVKKYDKLSKLNSKIEKKEQKLYFDKNMEQSKKTDEYKKSSKVKQFIKKREYKKKLKNRYHNSKNSLKNKIKQKAKDTGKKLVEYIKSKNKKVLLILLLGIAAFFMSMQALNAITGFSVGMMNGIARSSYLSSEDVLSETNQEFSMLEQGLQSEIDNIESNYPGYDEYRIKGDSIGHDTHELLAYLTAKKGDFKTDEIENELKELFKKMYKKEYTSETITKYDSDGDPYSYKILTLTITKKSIDSIAREEFKDYEDNLSHYEILLASKGNMELIFGTGSGNLSEIVNNPDFSNPGIAFDDADVQTLFNEAEKHIGKRYVFGANGPNNFDCSSFVCWSFTKSGIKNMPRTTAWGIYKNYCNPVSPSEAKAGDIIFFHSTYASHEPISHVGIYAGNGMMLHAGDPIKYASIETKYWKDHFFGFGRVSD